jgi:uncharacterized C2H2 Zn-finger protein
MAKARRFEVGARERLPRTNAEAAEYWADGILAREEMPSLSVNSVLLRGDTIYSFGTHFPMAKMVRDSRGRVRRVVLNSDNYPARGWANTGWDQSNVKRAVEDRVERARHKVIIDRLPLSEYGIRPLRMRPALDDIEPDPYPQAEVPVYFEAWNPGPEPVDDGEGCVAGTREPHTFSDTMFVSEDELREDDERLGGDFDSPSLGTRIYVRRTTEGFVEYSREHPNHWDQERAKKQEPRVELRQCPHCVAFFSRHRAWNIQMNGGHDWVNGRYRRIPGFKRHQELRAKFGGEQGWRTARREDFRRVRRLRKLREEWEARNYCTLSEAPTDRHGIVKLDADGFVPRRPVERVRERRAIERRKLQRKRERELREYNAHLRQLAIARKKAVKEWAAHGVIVADDDVIHWCVRHGIKPNPDDGTITLVKAVQPGSYRSGYNGGMEYRPGTTVTAPDFDNTSGCGRGLHFGPNKRVAATNLGYYVHTGVEPVFLACRVAADAIIPVGDKCKAPSCYGEGEL